MLNQNKTVFFPFILRAFIFRSLFTVACTTMNLRRPTNETIVFGFVYVRFVLRFCLVYLLCSFRNANGKYIVNVINILSKNCVSQFHSVSDSKLYYFNGNCKQLTDHGSRCHIIFPKHRYCAFWLFDSILNLTFTFILRHFFFFFFHQKKTLCNIEKLSLK